MRRFWLAGTIATALTVLAVQSATAAVQVSKDGGFEHPVLSVAGETSHTYSDGEHLTLPDQQQAPWVVRQGTVELDDTSVYPSLGGAQSLALNGTGPGSVYQDIPTVVGRRYLLTYHIGYPVGDGSGSWAMEVRAGFTKIGGDGGTTCAVSDCWITTDRIIFKATHDVTRLTFTSLTAGDHTAGPHIDDVRVTLRGAP